MPPSFVIRELARQLDSWHATLPMTLRWPLTGQSESLDVFAEDEELPDGEAPGMAYGPDVVGSSYRQAYTIIANQLKTRFYYARFMLYRGYIYKTLHTPEKMSATDADYCGIALRMACEMPNALQAVRDYKRLFPHLFSWTQTCLSILLIFRMTFKNRALYAICSENVMQETISDATTILLDWLRDIRQLDGVAEWSYNLIMALSGES